MILVPLLIAILLAENVCLVFWFYTRPDRAVRLAEKEKTEFLKKTSMQILNRAWGVQGAPAMDDEFDEPEVPVASNRALQDLEPQEAQERLRVLQEEIDLETIGKRSPGSIARRRDKIGEIHRLEKHIADNPPRPDPGPVGGVPYISKLEPDEMEHLGALREN